MEKQPQQHCSGVDQPFAVTAATVEPTSRLPDGWTRCHAYLAHKKRYCRQQPVVVVVLPTNNDTNNDTNNHDSKVHSRYCGNHLHLFSLDASPVHHHKHHHKHHHSSSSSSSRIPCPVDPSHWIAAHRVASHIRVCPATKKRYAQTQPDFIRVAMNAGGHGCVSAGDRHDTDDNTEDNDNKTIRRPNQLSWDAQKRLALRVLTVYQRLFSSEPVSQSTSTSSLSSSFSNKNVTTITMMTRPWGIPCQDRSAGEFQAGLESAVAQYRIRSGGIKQLQQQASLLGHLRYRWPYQTSRTRMMVPEQEYCNHNNNNNDDDDDPCCPIPTNRGQEAPTVAQPEPSPPIVANPSPPSSTATMEKKATRTTILELGAGRGMTGLMAAGVLAAAAASSSQSSSPSITTRLILVERAGPSRSKADTILRRAAAATAATAAAVASEPNKKKDGPTKNDSNQNNHHQQQQQPNGPGSYMDLSRVEWKRIACDVADLDLTKIVDYNNEPLEHAATGETYHCQKEETLVVIAKHLCGAGTDLALKALEPIKHKVSVCILATCCHGVCKWEDYVGRDYLRAIMQEDEESVDGTGTIYGEEAKFGCREFDQLCRWSAGTVLQNLKKNVTKKEPNSNDKNCKATNMVDDEHPSNQPSTGQDNAATISALAEALDLACGPTGLGRACQRLIDYGRKQYMEQVLFPNAAQSQDLVYYVSEDITPQNALLIGGND